MPEPLKNLYSPAYVASVGEAVRRAWRTFDADAFSAAVLGPGWAELELKGRMRRITESLHRHLPLPYRRQLDVLREAAPGFGNFTAMFFPEFVELHGLDDFEPSVAALEHFTRFSSSEFAVRPFILRHDARMMRVMRAWADHENEHVRRLASEGCRPRLPWAMALPAFKRDPAPVLPILEALRADPSEYVRRSVANNLNDIAKDNPDVTLAVAERWIGASPDTDWIVRHASRTLLKRGHPRALALFGLRKNAPATVEDLVLDAPRVRRGGRVGFSFAVRNPLSRPLDLRVEYVMHFQKANGSLSPKVFQVAERAFAPGREEFVRAHSFRDLTTRVHHPGLHRLAISINGVEKAAVEFELK